MSAITAAVISPSTGAFTTYSVISVFLSNPAPYLSVSLPPEGAAMRDDLPRETI